MQCRIHPHPTSETSWSTVFGGDVGETEMSLHSCTERGSTHRGLTSIPREAAWTLPGLGSVFAFPSRLLTTQHGVGRSVRDQPPSEQPHIVLWLLEPVHDLLTYCCNLSAGRACRGATRKDHRLAATGRETHQAETLPLPRAATHVQHTTGGRDHSGDQQLQRQWQPPLTGMKQKQGNLRNFPVSACNRIDLPRALGRHMCWLVAWATDGFEGEERARQRELPEHTRETTNHQLTWAPSWGTWWL